MRGRSNRKSINNHWTNGQRASLAIGSLAVLVAILIVYSNALQTEFVFDDHTMIVTRQSLRDSGALPAIFTSRKLGGLAYRPLRMASYWLDYRLFGLDPMGYHLSNLLLHAATSVAALVVARRLLPFRAALFAALLFAVHPIQTESVTYISGRRDLLCGLFVLLGCYAFLRYRDQGGVRWLGFAGGAFLLGLLSKEMAVTLPLLLLAFDVVKAPEQGLWRRIIATLRRDWWLYLVPVGAGIAFGLYIVIGLHASRQAEYYGGSLAMTLLTTARVFVHYLKLLVFPATLTADYSYNAFPVTTSWADPNAWLALIILGLVLLGLIRLASTNHVAAFGGLWFFIALLPVAQLIPHHELMAEHYLYLPSFGLFLMIGALMAPLSQKGTGTALAHTACLLILALLGVRTLVRNQDWKDDLTLWTKTVQTAPEAARARDNLGRAYIRRGLDALAERQFEEAVRIKPDEPSFHDNLGLALFRQGKLADAESQLRTALQGNPQLVSAHMNLGLTLLKAGRVEEAEAEFHEALRIRPTVAMAWEYLGRIRLQAGRPQEARTMIEKAIQFDPSRRELQQLLSSLPQ